MPAFPLAEVSTSTGAPKIIAQWFKGSERGLAMGIYITGPVLMVSFNKRRRGLLLGFAVMFLVTRFWLVLITTVWLAILTTLYDDATYDSLIDQIGGPIRFLSIFWLEVAVIACTFGFALVTYVFRTRDKNNGGLDESE